MPHRLVRIDRSATDGTPSFEFLRELTDDEVSVFEQSHSALQEFKQTRRLMDLVLINDETVSTLQDSVIARSTGDRRTEEPELTGLVHHLDAAVVNYLTATRLYLDHRHRQLKRRYGDDSPQLLAFTQQRALEYDSFGEYRFVYKLRNYVQHCGMPLQVARTSRRLIVRDGAEAVEFVPMYGCKREQLLEEYDEWGAAKAFLKSQAAEFPLLPLLQAFTDSLRRIDRTVLAQEAGALWYAGKRLLTIVAEACDDRHTAGIGDLVVIGAEPAVPGGPRQYNMSLKEPHVDVLARLGLVALLSESPWWRILPGRLSSDVPPTFVG